MNSSAEETLPGSSVCPCDMKHPRVVGVGVRRSRLSISLLESLERTDPVEMPMLP